MALPSSGPLSLSDIQTEFGGSNPISLSEYYAGGAYVAAGTTGTYGAVPSSGTISIQNFYGTSAVVRGEQSYTTPGTYSWVAPAGVTRVSIVAVGGGGGGASAGGGGGGLSYKNNHPVTPGSSYTVVVGAGGIGVPSYNAAQSGGNSRFETNVATGGGACGSSGGTGCSQAGGNGGSGGGGGGGGAAGYSGNGGGTGTAGAGGGGGGAGYVGFTDSGVAYFVQPGGGGGGVGLFGSGSNGAAGQNGVYSSIGSRGGGGGSGGNTGSNAGTVASSPAGAGGSVGGGGGMGGFVNIYCPCYANVIYYCGASGSAGGVRIVWPGSTRLFPSTDVGTP